MARIAPPHRPRVARARANRSRRRRLCEDDRRGIAPRRSSRRRSPDFMSSSRGWVPGNSDFWRSACSTSAPRAIPFARSSSAGGTWSSRFSSSAGAPAMRANRAAASPLGRRSDLRVDPRHLPCLGPRRRRLPREQVTRSRGRVAARPAAVAHVATEDSAMSKSSPMPSYRTSLRWTEKEARAALAALAKSRLTIRAFASREGLDVQRLYVWRRKLETPAGTNERSAPPFVEIRSGRPERVEVVVRTGRVLRCAEEISLRRRHRSTDARPERRRGDRSALACRACDQGADTWTWAARHRRHRDSGPRSQDDGGDPARHHLVLDRCALGHLRVFGEGRLRRRSALPRRATRADRPVRRHQHHDLHRARGRQASGLLEPWQTTPRRGRARRRSDRGRRTPHHRRHLRRRTRIEPRRGHCRGATRAARQAHARHCR